MGARKELGCCTDNYRRNSVDRTSRRSVCLCVGGVPTAERACPGEEGTVEGVIADTGHFPLRDVLCGSPERCGH